MNPALARIYFPNDEEPEEVYHEHLFQVRQYYFQQLPVPKVAQAKAKKLLEMHRAFVMRFGYEPFSERQIDYPDFGFQQDLLLDFHKIEQIRSFCRTQLSWLNHAAQAAEFLLYWYELELLFASKFASVCSGHDLTKVVLKAPDAVRLNQEIKTASVENALTLGYLKNAFENLTGAVQQELLRCAKMLELHERM